jgi:Nucleotidyltransferase of unknown function (DUF6036)
MRRLVDRARLLEFMRATTIDVDLEVRPESDQLLRAIPRLKEDLEINVELASPGHFIPELPGWEERSPLIAREGVLSFHHYDFYAQALAKIERGHARDVVDVREMHARHLIDPARLAEFFAAIEPQLYRYPAIDPGTFRKALERTRLELLSAGF